MKEERIDSIEYVVCEADIINAWYEARTGKYYVSSRFRRVLTRDELKAVLLHEERHKEGEWIHRIVVPLISFTWYFAALTVATFLTMLIILRTEPASTIALIGFLIPLTPAATVFAMTWNWIQEHDSDVYASRKAGYQATASALVKAVVYGSAEEYLEYIDEIKMNQQAYLNSSRLPSFLGILKYVLRESWNAPLWYWQFIKKPYYRTHPPLKYRLAKLQSIGES